MRGLIRAAEVYVYWRLFLEVAGVMFIAILLYELWAALKASATILGVC